MPDQVDMSDSLGMPGPLDMPNLLNMPDLLNMSDPLLLNMPDPSDHSSTRYPCQGDGDPYSGPYMVLQVRLLSLGFAGYPTTWGLLEPPAENLRLGQLVELREREEPSSRWKTRILAIRVVEDHYVEFWLASRCYLCVPRSATSHLMPSKLETRLNLSGTLRTIDGFAPFNFYPLLREVCPRISILRAMYVRAHADVNTHGEMEIEEMCKSAMRIRKIMIPPREVS